MPTLSLRSCGGSPAPVSALRISTGTLFRLASSPDSASEERRCTSSPPGKRAVTRSLISSTTLLVVAKITLSPTAGDPWPSPGKTKSMRPSMPPSRQSRLGKRHRRLPRSSAGPNSSSPAVPSPRSSRNRANSSVSGDAPTRRMFVTSRTDRNCKSHPRASIQ